MSRERHLRYTRKVSLRTVSIVCLASMLVASGCLRLGLARLLDPEPTDSGPKADADSDTIDDGGIDADASDGRDDAHHDADLRIDAEIDLDRYDSEPDGDEIPDDMQFIAEGPFMMGCNSDVDWLCDDDEEPYHEVHLDAFAIDTTEVTQQAFDDCIEAGACTPPSSGFSPTETPLHPVVHVTWEQARDYCQWMDRRLPTEAEWEKAARGTDGRIYPWGNEHPDCTMANFDRCNESPIDVGSYPMNVSPYGAIDMAGNASEWTNDWFDASYYESSPPSNPPGPASGSSRVVRGSSFAFGRQSVRTSNRIDSAPDPENNGRGFRCGRSAP